MNYYNEIKNELINNEAYKKAKDYFKNRSDLKTYYNVGKLLSEAGKHYGESIIKNYSDKLTTELGKGYTTTNLRYMKQFYLFCTKYHTVCDVLNFIDENVNNKFSIQDIADCFFFNRFYIMKLFKKELKISINNYINIRRIYNSLPEIKNTNESYLNIALNNGFNSLEYFSEAFKNIIGVPPSTYKKFTYFIIKTTDEELEIIRKSLYKISSIIYDIEKYKNNTKPEIKKEKKLSIF